MTKGKRKNIKRRRRRRIKRMRKKLGCIKEHERDNLLADNKATSLRTIH